jgi:hypothetical protein
METEPQHLPSSLGFGPRATWSREHGVRSPRGRRVIPRLNDLEPDSEGVDKVGRFRDIRSEAVSLGLSDTSSPERVVKRGSPDRRGEPVLERKRLASVPSAQAVLGQLEEPEVDPCDEEAELDEDVGRRAEEHDEDVGEEEVEAREGLPLARGRSDGGWCMGTGRVVEDGQGVVREDVGSIGRPGGGLVWDGIRVV